MSIERTQPKFADFALALMEQQVLAHLMSIVKQQIKRLMYVLPIWCLFVQYRLEIKETLANVIISEPIHFCSPEISRTIPQHSLKDVTQPLKIDIEIIFVSEQRRHCITETRKAFIFENRIVLIKYAILQN